MTCVTLQATIMIKSWKHKGLKKFYESGDKSGIQPRHAKALGDILFQLANAISAEDMNTPGNDFHKLIGNMKGHFSVTVQANWRVTFMFQDGNAIVVDYQDYH